MGNIEIKPATQVPRGSIIPRIKTTSQSLFLYAELKSALKQKEYKYSAYLKGQYEVETGAKLRMIITQDGEQKLDFLNTYEEYLEGAEWQQSRN